MARRVLLALLTAAIVVAGCGGGDEPATAGTTAIPTPGLPITYHGADGVTATVEDASRIVTLSGEFTEIVFALGLGPNVVGVDLSSVYPPEETRSLPKIGVEFRLIAEPIIALEPTVVIGDTDAIPKTVIEQVRGAGVPVVIFPARTDLDAPAAKIRETAHVLGVDEVGEALAADVQEKIDGALELVARSETRPKVAFVYVASDDTILTFGTETIGAGLLEAAGAENVAASVGIEGWVPITPEVLAAGQPEYIITASRGVDTVGGMDGFLAIPGVAETPAGREGRILVYEDLYLLGLGPRAGELLEEVAVDLHPELAP